MNSERQRSDAPKVNKEKADVLYDSVISGLTDAPVQFGLIPPDHWNQPPWIDEDKASAARDEMASKDVMYGGKCLHNPVPFSS